MASSLESLPEFLSVKQFADFTNTNRRTVEKMCSLGRVAAQKLPGTNSWRIHKASLRKWIEGFRLEEEEVARG